MEVISRGEGREYICSGTFGCNSRLKVLLSDMYLSIKTDYRGDTDTYTMFKCCVCGKENMVANYAVAGVHKR